MKNWNCNQFFPILIIHRDLWSTRLVALMIMGQIILVLIQACCFNNYAKIILDYQIINFLLNCESCVQFCLFPSKFVTYSSVRVSLLTWLHYTKLYQSASTEIDDRHFPNSQIPTNPATCPTSSVNKYFHLFCISLSNRSVKYATESRSTHL